MPYWDVFRINNLPVTDDPVEAADADGAVDAAIRSYDLDPEDSYIAVIREPYDQE